ncbi:hypothetical protein 101101UKE1_054 [Escherichia phage vB_EcoP-101101UKE1]|uniref:Uncharacterized protein n=1 Tax=Escherichia phage vB_EcoP-101101UKE1 TaxID=2865789 RepID=A0AAE8C630_9CAUD|nr:hypothetical protein 101101UKE1_054 [Escherichia phage vB_EcoP-101101UKE1]
MWAICSFRSLRLRSVHSLTCTLGYYLMDSLG